MFDGNEFIHLAGKLCVLRDAAEAEFRTAASRAYYGAFHLANQFMDELGFTVPDNENAHGQLRLRLLNSGEPTCVAAGKFLREMHQNRLVADYKLEIDKFQDAAQARLIVERAHKFRGYIEECRTEPIRSQVVSGIAAYLDVLG